MKRKWNIPLIRIVISLLLFMTGLLFRSNELLSNSLFFVAYIVIGMDILVKAVTNMFHLEWFDENFLMAIATVGAFCIGEYPEGVAVMLFFQIGEYIQEIAINRSRKSITGLLDLKSDDATIETSSGLIRKKAIDVKIGDTIVVKPGEKIALDGVVIEGTSHLDMTSLTGEAMPSSVKHGDNVLSGSINLEQVLKIKVTVSFQNSTASKILAMMEEVNENKASSEKFITKFSKIYTPIVVVLAILLSTVPLLFGGVFDVWLNRALVFLVISCPCALVISIPLGFFCGIGLASKHGILVKSSEAIEKLSKLKTIVFDKTGTLTEGKFQVNHVNPIGVTETELLMYASGCEFYSNHPIADSIRNAYQGDITVDMVKNHQEVSGYGVESVVNGDMIYVGNYDWMMKKDITATQVMDTGTVLYVAKNEVLIGTITISDALKMDSYRMVKCLEQLGIHQFVILSGDEESIVKEVSEKLSISEYHSGLLPMDKVTFLREVQERHNKNEYVAFVGDGMNDALVIAASDIGVTLGGIGSDAAIEASDIVIMNDQVSKVATAITIARKTERIIWTNIIFAIGIKLIVLLLGSLGYASIWSAVFSDVGVTVLAILNAIRILRWRIN